MWVPVTYIICTTRATGLWDEGECVRGRSGVAKRSREYTMLGTHQMISLIGDDDVIAVIPTTYWCIDVRRCSKFY